MYFAFLAKRTAYFSRYSKPYKSSRLKFIYYYIPDEPAVSIIEHCYSFHCILEYRTEMVSLLHLRSTQHLIKCTSNSVRAYLLSNWKYSPIVRFAPFDLKTRE